MEQTLTFFTLISCCVILITGLGEAAIVPSYEVVQDVGWIRLHIVPATWADARLRCQLEGATLASPRTSAIAVAMRTTMLAHKLAQSSVFTDIHKHDTNTDGDFRTIDGLPVSNISLQWATGEPDNLNNDEDCLAMTGAGELADVSCSSVYPYYCIKPIKPHAKVAETKCDTTSEGYQMEPSTGSCYKFHRRAIPWRRADMVCRAEHARLAVINSEQESHVLQKIFARNPEETIQNDNTSIQTNKNYASLGFLDWKEQSQFMTVFGETLAEAGFNKWAPGEPNHPGVENCGSMTRAGLLNDASCVKHALPFVCESTLTPVGTS